MSPRASHQRPTGARRYGAIFHVASEGKKTERNYLAFLNNKVTKVQVKQVPYSNSDPQSVLKAMRKYLRNEGPLQRHDQVWIVVDRDRWSEQDLDRLVDWAREGDHYNIAVSNPKFEYWLLLHFEDGASLSGSACSSRLESRLPNYEKNLDTRTFTQQMIDDAIRRAKQRDSPACDDWPRTLGQTMMYRLVENIFQLNQLLGGEIRT